MQYLSTLLVFSAMAFSSVTMAMPVDPSTHSLVKRATWVFGKSKCPDNDGDQYNGPKGGAWRIDCGKDTVQGGYLDESPDGNVDFKTCIQLCGNIPSKCVRVSFVGPISGGSCYLKGSKSSALTPVDNHKVATKLNS